MTEFSDLWTEHRHVVRDVAYRVLGSVAEAEDVTQDTYVRLLARLDDPGAEPLDAPRAWLITVASRLAIDRLRARKRIAAHGRARFTVEPAVARLLTERFAAAASDGDLDGLAPTSRSRR